MGARASALAALAVTVNAAPLGQHQIARRGVFNHWFNTCPSYVPCANGDRHGYWFLTFCDCDTGFQGTCCEEQATCEVPPINAKAVDLEEYTRATWFVQRQQENAFQKKEDFNCNTATYDLGSTTVPDFNGQVINVNNYGNKGAVNGDANGDPLCARVTDTDGQLLVAPCFLGNDQAGPYWIMDIGVQENGEYEWAVVIGGQPAEFGEDGKCTTSTTDISNSGLWFLTRNPVATPEQIRAMEDAIARQGVSGTKLIDVKQEGCNYEESDIKPRREAGVLAAAPYGANFQAGCDTAADALLFLNSPQNPDAVQQTCVEVDGLKRCYYTYTPLKARNAEGNAPAVVHLHGAGGCASLPAAGWGPIAEREGIVMVWPQGTSFVPNRPGPPIPQPSWNDGSGLFPAQENNIDDMTFLSQVLEQVAHLSTVDASKIYFSGHSNGAVMAQRFSLQQTTTQKVAGVLAFSGAGLPNDQITQDFLKVKVGYEPTPIVLVAGTLDNVVSFGERRGPLAGAIPSTEGWARINDCAEQAVEQVNGYNKYSYTGCSDAADVLLVEVPSAGHHPFVKGEGVFQIQEGRDIAFCPFKFIPGTPPDTPDCTLVTVDATQVAWDFITKGATSYVAPPQAPPTGPPTAGPPVGGPPAGGCTDILDSTPSPVKCEEAIATVTCDGNLQGFDIANVCAKSCNKCGGETTEPEGPCTTPKPIETFPIDREEFVRASWFVQYQMETPQSRFPEDFFCVSATYDAIASGVETPQGVSITASNAGAAGSPVGQTNGIVLCVGSTEVDGELRVAPCPIFERVEEANFNVIAVGTNEDTGEYEWAVILGGGAPAITAEDGLCLPAEESGLFLYTREQVASDEVNAAMLAAVEAAGVSTSKLEKVVQAGCGNYGDRRLKPSALAGPAVPTDFGAFCPNGFPQGDPKGDCDTIPAGPPVGGPPAGGCTDILNSTPSPVKCEEAIATVTCDGNLQGFDIANVCAKSCNKCGPPAGGPPAGGPPVGPPTGAPVGALPPCFLVDQGILAAGTPCA